MNQQIELIGFRVSEDKRNLLNLIVKEYSEQHQRNVLEYYFDYEYGLDCLMYTSGSVSFEWVSWWVKAFISGWEAANNEV